MVIIVPLTSLTVSAVTFERMEFKFKSKFFATVAVKDLVVFALRKSNTDTKHCKP
jgi:hypothetical protein